MGALRELRNLRNPLRGAPQARYHSVLTGHRALSASATQAQQQVESWEANLTGVDEDRLVGPRGDWWWTGKRPDEILEPGARTLHSLPQPTLDTVTEEQVKQYFDNTWTLTESLFSGLQGEEAFYRPPYHHLRHPMAFYYGHTATFYTNKLRVAGLVDQGLHPYFEDIFEVGVDEMRWDDMSKNAMQWPAIGEVHEYRQRTYELVTRVIEEHISGSGTRKVDSEHPLWALFMAFEHDRIHLETSSVLIRELPLQLLRKPEHWPEPHESAFASAGPATAPLAGRDFPRNEMVAVQGRTDVRIGKEAAFPTFGWDNEYGMRDHAKVPDFEASKFMVSNGEFFDFVQDGGYRSREYWTEDGWGWRVFRNAKWPFFWSQAGPSGNHEYRLRTTFEIVDMPWSWPVNVNKHEATAFCNWKAAKDRAPGLRLVTEAEHMLLREEHQRHPVRDAALDPALTHSGKSISEEAGVNLNLAYGSETPVDAHPANANGFHDVTGNAWEWAEDDFNPLPGFAVHPFYDDFSTPCFDGEHNMILGGSFMSSGDAGANLQCRYHFRPHFLQHSGFRYVQPSVVEPTPGHGVAARIAPGGGGGSGGGQQAYETESLVNQYLALHFGQRPGVAAQTIREHAELPRGALDFPARCAELVRRMAEESGARLGPEARALDLGCAVGGASFELGKHFGGVTGIDFSQAFVHTAEQIRDAPGKAIRFSVPVEACERRENIEARLDPDFDYSHVRFLQGDACALGPVEDLGGPFDAILMANLLCRLPQPERCLASLNALVRPGGVVVTVSPFSWLEDFTAPEQWLHHGGKGSREVLEEMMRGYGFEQVHTQDMPLLIREHERKYQYIVSHAAVFRKNN